MVIKLNIFSMSVAIAKGEEYTLFKGLFDKVRKRDEQSQRILFEMFYRRVYDTAYFITQDRHLAQVVVQETFFKAFQRMDRLNDGEKMGAWLGAIATRTALDLLRKVKRWNDIATEDVYIEEEFSKNQSVPTVENIVEERFLKKLLHQQIHELTPEYRQVIVLKYEYDLKDEEIAKELGINVGTVKSRLFRAKHKLRALLEKQPEFKDGEIR